MKKSNNFKTFKITVEKIEVKQCIYIKRQDIKKVDKLIYCQWRKFIK